MKKYIAYEMTVDEIQEKLRTLLDDSSIYLEKQGLNNFYEAESYSQYLDGADIDERLAQILDVKECRHYATEDDGIIVLVREDDCLKKAMGMCNSWNCKDCEHKCKDDANDKEVETLWEELEDVTFEEDEDGNLVLLNDWQGWSKGTDRQDIWGWFAAHHSKGLYYLVNEYEC